MRFNPIGGVLLLDLSIGLLLGQSRLLAQPSRGQSASGWDTKISVFFGTVKAMDVGEIRTNALTALKMKGYIVPHGASCVINVGVAGPKPGCVVMFWDLETKWKYQVEFDGKGDVSHIWAGPMQHGTVGPNDPLPKFPEGGVKVKP